MFEPPDDGYRYTLFCFTVTRRARTRSNKSYVRYASGNAKPFTSRGELFHDEGQKTQRKNRSEDAKSLIFQLGRVLGLHETFSPADFVHFVSRHSGHGDKTNKRRFARADFVLEYR